MKIKKKKERRDISSAKENDFGLLLRAIQLRFMFDIGVIKDNFCEAMEDL